LYGYCEEKETGDKPTFFKYEDTSAGEFLWATILYVTNVPVYFTKTRTTLFQVKTLHTNVQNTPSNNRHI